MPNFVPPPSGRLIVKRDNQSITHLVPKSTIVIDTRKQDPFSFARFPNWVSETVVKGLPTGDYSVVGMEGLLALERKNLGDLIVTLMHSRQRFIRECDRLAEFPYRAILIEASYEDICSPYHEYTEAHPNGISGSLDAIETRYSIPVIYIVNSQRERQRPGSQRHLLIGGWKIMDTVEYSKKEICDRSMRCAQYCAPGKPIFPTGSWRPTCAAPRPP